eukprot:2925242-Pyramimonas_sp.AAC.1
MRPLRGPTGGGVPCPPSWRREPKWLRYCCCCCCCWGAGSRAHPRPPNGERQPAWTSNSVLATAVSC